MKITELPVRELKTGLTGLGKVTNRSITLRVLHFIHITRMLTEPARVGVRLASKPGHGYLPLVHSRRDGIAREATCPFSRLA